MTDILFEIVGRAGVVTLNKPETLNAVTDDMLTALDEHLKVWEGDAAVERVIIKAVPGRAFSAGGDIRHLYERGMAKDYDFDFFAREYRLNVKIAKYPKPYIAMVDGIAMGGGVGVSFHGSHRLAGSNMSFAMPEVGIGFFPDVGASYLLSRLPGKLGLYLGLTGNRIGQGDAVWSGLATHGYDSEKQDELFAALCDQKDFEAEIANHAVKPTADIEQMMEKINHHFAAPTLTEVLENLQDASQDDEWAAKTHKTLRQKSPLSLAVAFQQISSGANASIEECMQMEYRILRRILVGEDFYEGIRAAIIDKDRNPVWTHKDASTLGEDIVNSHFEPLGKNELFPA